MCSPLPDCDQVVPCRADFHLLLRIVNFDFFLLTSDHGHSDVVASSWGAGTRSAPRKSSNCNSTSCTSSSSSATSSHAKWTPKGWVFMFYLLFCFVLLKTLDFFSWKKIFGHFLTFLADFENFGFSLKNYFIIKNQVFYFEGFGNYTQKLGKNLDDIFGSEILKSKSLRKWKVRARALECRAGEGRRPAASAPRAALTRFNVQLETGTCCSYISPHLLFVLAFWLKFNSFRGKNAARKCKICTFSSIFVSFEAKKKSENYL